MYIGNTPTTQAFTPAIDYFSGNGSTVAFTLSRQVASVAQVQAVIENVPQSPGTAFTVSGNVITFTSAPPSGTNNIYVYYTSPITQVIAPGQGTVGTAALDPNIALSGQSLTVAGNNISATNSLGFRNRIINGDMRIDQRNNGAAVTATSGGGYFYATDRFITYNLAGVNFTTQRVAEAPAGFTNSNKLTFANAFSLTATGEATFQQVIEGLNIADLGWGAAGAQSVTVSFWVRASFTGTFSVGFTNSAGTRAYATTYTINSANTWEQKTVTIPGDTSGIWATDNSAGMFLRFMLASGSNFVVSANNAWTTRAGAYNAADSIYGTRAIGAATSISAGATWQITGVQLEAGSVATPFERKPYGTELVLCQRYYYENVAAVGTGIGSNSIARATALHPVEMRAAPSVTIANTVQFFNGGATVTCTGGLNNYSTPRMFNADISIGSGGVTGYATCMVQPPTGKVTVSAEL